MSKTNNNTDPYAPPPMHHDRSGPVLRVILLGGLLGAAALGYVWMSGQETPLAPESAQPQQVAEAGYQVSENTLPQATAESLPPAPAPTATPAPQRRSAPAERAPAPAPQPDAVTPPPAPAAATPIPPIDTPPAGAAGSP